MWRFAPIYINIQGVDCDRTVTIQSRAFINVMNGGDSDLYPGFGWRVPIKSKLEEDNDDDPLTVLQSSLVGYYLDKQINIIFCIKKEKKSF